MEHVHVHSGGQAIVGNVKAGDGAAVKPAPPLAIGQEQAGITLDDLIGKQPELVGGRGMTEKSRQNPIDSRRIRAERGPWRSRRAQVWCAHRAGLPCKAQAMRERPMYRCTVARHGAAPPEGLQRIVEARTVHGGYGAEMRELRKLVRALRRGAAASPGAGEVAGHRDQLAQHHGGRRCSVRCCRITATGYAALSCTRRGRQNASLRGGKAHA